MRAVVAAVLLAIASPAHAGVVGIDLGSTHQSVKVEPGKTATLPFTHGRWQLRLVVDQKAEGRAFRFTVRLERQQGDVVEVLANENLVTGPGLDALTEVDTRLGPLTLRCRG